MYGESIPEVWFKKFITRITIPAPLTSLDLYRVMQCPTIIWKKGKVHRACALLFLDSLIQHLSHPINLSINEKKTVTGLTLHGYVTVFPSKPEAFEVCLIQTVSWSTPWALPSHGGSAIKKTYELYPCILGFVWFWSHPTFRKKKDLDSWPAKIGPAKKTSHQKKTYEFRGADRRSKVKHAMIWHKQHVYACVYVPMFLCPSLSCTALVRLVAE